MTTTPAPTAPAPAVAATGSRNDGYEHVESDLRYRVSKRVETVTDTPGTIKHLSVAVFVDDRTPIVNTADLQKAVAACVGIQEARGDQVVIQRVPFAKQEEEAGGNNTTLAKLSGLYHGYLNGLLAFALLGVFLVLARGLVKTQGGAGLPGQHLDLTSGERAAPPLSLPAPGNAEAAFNPDRATQVIRTWLASGEVH